VPGSFHLDMMPVPSTAVLDCYANVPLGFFPIITSSRRVPNFPAQTSQVGLCENERFTVSSSVLSRFEWMTLLEPSDAVLFAVDDVLVFFPLNVLLLSSVVSR
jgi:hypothetical protein